MLQARDLTPEAAAALLPPTHALVGLELRFVGWKGALEVEGPRGSVSPLSLCLGGETASLGPPSCDEGPPACAEVGKGPFWTTGCGQPDPGDTALGEGSLEEGYLILFIS